MYLLENVTAYLIYPVGWFRRLIRLINPVAPLIVYIPPFSCTFKPNHARLDHLQY